MAELCKTIWQQGWRVGQNCNLNWGVQHLRHVDQEFQTFFRLKTEMTLKRQGSGNAQGSHLVWMRIRLKNRLALPMSRESHKSELHHLRGISNHRLISWRSCSKKASSLQWSLMTSSISRLMSSGVEAVPWFPCILRRDRARPLAWRMWFTYSRCLRNRLKCRVFTSAGKQHGALKKNSIITDYQMISSNDLIIKSLILAF